VEELPRAIKHPCLQIVVGVNNNIADLPIADLEIHRIGRRFIQEPVPVACTGLETRTHSSCTACEWRNAELEPGDITTIFTPKLVSPNTSPSERFTRPLIRDRNGSG
jgi:hypothetical protein